MELSEQQGQPRFQERVKHPTYLIGSPLNTPVPTEPPVISTETLVQSLVAARIILGPEKFKSLVRLAGVAALGGETKSAIFLNWGATYAFNPLWTLSEQGLHVFAPHKPPDQFRNIIDQFGPIIFNEEPFPGVEAFERQQFELFTRLSVQLQRNILTGNPQLAARSQELYQQLIHRKRSLDFSGIGPLTAVQPDFKTDTSFLAALYREAARAQDQFGQNIEDDFGGPLTGAANTRGGTADP